MVTARGNLSNYSEVEQTNLNNVFIANTTVQLLD